MDEEQDLQFLLIKSDYSDYDDEYGEELHKRIANEGEYAYQDYQTSTMERYLDNAGENDFIQAALQPMIDVEPLIKYVLLQKFKMRERVEEEPKQLSELLFKVFNRCCM